MTRDEGSVGISVDRDQVSTRYFTHENDTVIESIGDIESGQAGISVDSEIGDVQITSLGNITTRDAGSVGISVRTDDGGDISIDSTGDITAGEAGIAARLENYGGISITNSGEVTGRGSHGIFLCAANGGAISLTNTGTISGAMAGVFVDERVANSGATILNTGHIQGDGGFAIDLRGDGNDVVTLGFGSTIEGAMDFGNGNDGMGGSNAGDIDTLNIEAGVNLVLEFADASGTDSALASMPEFINVADSSGSAVVGNRLVVYEMGSFAAFSDHLSAFSGSVLNTLDAQQNAYHFTPPTAGLVTRSGRDWGSVGLRSWGTAFGSRSLQGSGDQVGDFQHNYFGFSAGFEGGHASDQGVFGFFAGAGQSDINLALGGGSIDINSAFAGVYWQRDLGAFNLRASLLGGITENETTRIFSGGANTGAFDGHFIIPSLTLSYPFELNGSQMMFSNRLSYLHMHLDSYNEVGTNPVFVHGRDVNLLNLRSQLEIASPFGNFGSSASQLNLRLGVDATIDVGSDPVVATLFGTAVPFELQGEDDIHGFLGFSFSHLSDDGRWDLSLTGEVRSDFDDGVAGNIGLNLVHRF